ncbi:MAG: hypothetical protein JWN65_4157 [Solirubrobacterales bacterium]|nr:hypothetical protein [Solirubrobacterales bacterium]
MVDDPTDLGPGAPPAGAAPQRVADLLRTFAPAPARRRRKGRPDAPQSIIPLLTLPEDGHTPIDPGRIDAARARMKAAAEAAGAGDATPSTPADVDPAAFDAARSRLRARSARPAPRRA